MDLAAAHHLKLANQLEMAARATSRRRSRSRRRPRTCSRSSAARRSIWMRSLKTLTESARSLSGAATANVLLRDGNVLRLRAEFGSPPNWREYVLAHPPRMGRGTGTGRVLMTGETVHIPDVLADPDYSYGEGPSIGNYRAQLGVPLLRSGKVEGVFGLLRPEPGAFTPRQIELVRSFADQAVIAIENARLFDEVQAKTRDLEESLQQQTATADVLKVISRSAFDLQPVFETLVSAAVELCGAFSGSIWVRDGDDFRCGAGAGPGNSEGFERYLRSLRVTPGRGSMAARVLVSGRVEEIPDVRDDPEYALPLSQHGQPARGLLGVPLVGKDRVEGSLTLSRLEPGRFTPRQIELVQTFADQAVIAIENARLFNEVQAKTRELEASLQQQTATADVLKVISRSAFDLDAVLRTLVELAAKLCEADKATITREVDGVFYRRKCMGFPRSSWVRSDPCLSYPSGARSPGGRCWKAEPFMWRTSRPTPNTGRRTTLSPANFAPVSASR